MAKLQVISPFEYNPSQDPANITFLQGIKGGDRPGTYLLTGSINATGPGSYGLVYEGPLDDVQRDGVSGFGSWYTIEVPQTQAFAGANGTSVYGPDNLGGGLVDLVGSYSRTVSGSSATAEDPNTVGFLYSGAIDGSTTAGYRSFQTQTRGRGPATYTFVHSVDGGWRWATATPPPPIPSPVPAWPPPPFWWTWPRAGRSTSASPAPGSTSPTRPTASGTTAMAATPSPVARAKWPRPALHGCGRAPAT
ncbi:MAG: hypothetical protein ACKO5F_05065 [Synechococcus sp.]